ncbi:divergent polysaccharide deacetylase family protein [Salsuginibacillus kocurii]|uniref:divergent polysaccharide deacetylase family protein n=1 Tax=Salsuginibacillus kocurii TaxID=427078 RepID=UPI00037491C2|nr:divergent polysaccharide deacetylase family protein [Salsuginibacillus kocurii]
MKRCSYFLSVLLLLFSVTSEAHATEGKSGSDYNVSIVIDDFGGGGEGTSELLDFDVPLTIAIMPFLSTSQEDAQKAQTAGHEVMIHMPMAASYGKASWLGPGGITPSMEPDEVRSVVKDAIEHLPEATGINNHMGSAVVTKEELMRPFLEEVQAAGLYVLDSATHGDSVIPEICRELGVPFASRDVFLDDTNSNRHFVEQQLQQLFSLGKEQQYAIGIGHVGVRGKETVAALSQVLTDKDKRKHIAPASAIILKEPTNNPDNFWQYQYPLNHLRD